MQMAVGQFKIHCLRLFEEVKNKKQRIIITKRGMPMAEIIPIREQKKNQKNSLLGSVTFEKDLLSPIDEKWGADS